MRQSSTHAQAYGPGELGSFGLCPAVFLAGYPPSTQLELEGGFGTEYAWYLCSQRVPALLPVSRTLDDR